MELGLPAPQHRHRNPPLMCCAAVLPQKNLLPGPKRATTVADRNGEFIPGQQRAQMCGHIIVILVLMTEHRVAEGIMRVIQVSISCRTVGSAFSQSMTAALVLWRNT